MLPKFPSLIVLLCKIFGVIAYLVLMQTPLTVDVDVHTLENFNSRNEKYGKKDPLEQLSANIDAISK